jgi:predicted PurR-regulated permease PerM
MNGLTLSDKQQKTVAAALTLLSAMFIFGFLAALAWAAGRFIQAFDNVLTPLMVAFVLAFILKPLYQRVRDTLKAPPALAVLIVYAATLLPLAAFLWKFGSLLIDQAAGLLERFPSWWAAATQFVEARWPVVVEVSEKYGLRERVRSAVEEHPGVLAGGLEEAARRLWSVGANVFQAVAGVLSWLVLPVYLAFFLMARPFEARALESGLPFLKPETRRDAVYLLEEFINILVAFFRGQIVIALLQGLLFAAGFMLAGLQYGFALGLMLGFLNIIPYLGNLIGLAVALPLAFFQADGGAGKLGLVVGVFVVVQLVEGYVLTPRIMGKRTGLHPMAIVVAILFWGSALGGLTGMILAIPLTAFFVVFWRLLKNKYITEIV